MTSANVVYNGKGYYIPKLSKAIRGYIEISSQGKSLSVGSSHAIIEGGFSMADKKIIISGIDVIQEIENGRATSANVNKSEAEEVPREGGDLKSNILGRFGTIEKNVECPKCHQNTLNTVGGFPWKNIQSSSCKNPSCKYKKIGQIT